jgi:hypothetical protein
MSLTTPEPLGRLRELFGSYRAEWLRERVFELFREPQYFPDLETERPCVLIGGRGTGKTTALRGLSYEGQKALRSDTPDNWQYYGMYYRVNTNRVTAFAGSELSETKWIRYFGHYLNLIFCDLVLEFVDWYEAITATTVLNEETCKRVLMSLGLDWLPDSAMSTLVATELIRFEAVVNNIGEDSDDVQVSMQGAPLDLLVEGLTAPSMPLRGKQFFILLDEFENFLPYQQRVVNTLIKHGSDRYTFKIGVKELGWRTRATLAEGERLNSPADYARIRISESLTGATFREFAQSVCDSRLEHVGIEVDRAQSVPELFESIDDEREARLLGIESIAASIRTALRSELEEAEATALTNLPNLYIYLMDAWAHEKGRETVEEFRNYLADPAQWDTRYQNYKYSALFTIKRRKRGIRKYYSGWEVLTQLAGGNIRYLMELVENCLIAHVEAGGELGKPVLAELQTKAAIAVGQKNVGELEGVSVEGARLARLVLALGRVFQVMAEDPIGHTPEVNQFYIPVKDARSDTAHDSHEEERLEALIAEAVMHLALIRYPGTKLTSPDQIREYDYMLHPIFAPYFFYSHRRKRKIAIPASVVLKLAEDPQVAISKVLLDQGRGTTSPVPDHLSLFEGFYGHE